MVSTSPPMLLSFSVEVEVELELELELERDVETPFKMFSWSDGDMHN